MFIARARHRVTKSSTDTLTLTPISGCMFPRLSRRVVRCVCRVRGGRASTRALGLNTHEREVYIFYWLREPRPRPHNATYHMTCIVTFLFDDSEDEGDSRDNRITTRPEVLHRILDHVFKLACLLQPEQVFLSLNRKHQVEEDPLSRQAPHETRPGIFSSEAASTAAISTR
jgi:hypothetical protein